MSQGTLVSPEFFTEMRSLQHEAFALAEKEILEADRDFAGLVGRDSGGFLRVEGDREATVGILAMGSVYGTLKDAHRSGLLGRPVRLLCLRAFRPFPAGAIRAAADGLSDLIVLDRSLSPGSGGIVAHEIRSALYGTGTAPRVVNFAVGLGGRNVPGEIFREMLEALEKNPPAFSIFDLDPRKLPRPSDPVLPSS